MAFNNITFIKFRDFIHSNFGIYYSDSKKELLNIKIDKCLYKSGINSYDDFFDMISKSPDDTYLKHFIDEITVNKTDFFRGIEQFEFIKDNAPLIVQSNPQIFCTGEIKVWSMACSTGEEPYTLAMVLREAFPNLKVRLLATDISSRVLKKAGEGKYPLSLKKDIERLYIDKYFSNQNGRLEVGKDIKRLIKFRQFNLINPFPFSEKFDIVFCRNVMIYFNLETQQQIVDKIDNCLAPGGLLFLGLSESLVNKRHEFDSIKYSIYQKKH